MSGKAISVEEFVEKKAKMRVIDIRATSAFSNDVSQLPGSENVPLHNLEHHTKNWNRFETLLVVCADGQESVEGQEVLMKAGFVSVLRLDGGMDSWRQSDQASS